MHHRRSGGQRDAEESSSDELSEKWVDAANEPKLWEVSLTTGGRDDGHKPLHVGVFISELARY